MYAQASVGMSCILALWPQNELDWSTQCVSVCICKYFMPRDSMEAKANARILRDACMQVIPRPFQAAIYLFPNTFQVATAG